MIDQRPMTIERTLVALVATMLLACIGCAPSQGSTPTAAPSSALAPSAVAAPSVVSSSVALGAADIDRPLTAGSYRIDEPFDAPFTIAFPTEWTLKSLSENDVSFLNTAVNSGDGAAWITIDRVDTVFDDPCHGAPISPPVPSTVDGLVGALTRMVDFAPGRVSDVVIGGYDGKSVELTNAIDTELAGCNSGQMLPMWTIAGGGPAATNGKARENLWVLDVDGAPLLIDGTMFIPSTPATSRAEIGLIVESLRFGPAPPAPVPSIVVEAARPGLVDIGGRALFMECRGSGTPTVVFLAGSGVPRLAMREVGDALLGASVRVCDFDRAGEGQSEPAPRTQTDLDVVDDLSKLLASADIPWPYVLVGHSLGGDQAWLYADRHPAGLAGLLIMNAGFFELDWEAAGGVLTEAELSEERSLSEANLGSVKQAASPPAGMPYVVMMSTIAQCASPTDNCGRIYPMYEDWARELAGRTADGRFVSVEAGHEIYRSQPNVVVDAIRQLIALGS